MAVTFSHPPRHSHLLSRLKDSILIPHNAWVEPTTTTSSPSPADLSSGMTTPNRDPHDLPKFSYQSLLHPKAPVVYLLPLLSSLPEKIKLDPIHTEHPPLVTETRLPDIDSASLSLHRALHNFKPLTERYASAPYEMAFNWSELKLPGHEEREWYCVAFRSKRKAGSNGDSLYDADAKAHAEAVCNGGLIMYWYGIPDPETGMNLATCIWQSRRHATAANSRPHHIKAMRLAASSYEVYNLERYVLRKIEGEEGISVEPFIDGEVGW